ncbi:MAG TPA: DUF4232 domain-containing protein [Acidobacteriaceae bacterium]
MRLRSSPSRWIAGLATATLVAGCGHGGTTHSARSNAPGLREAAPLSGRGGANPNAPFLVVDHTVQLAKRSMPVDINAVQPCGAAQLSLFESGAQVDGERRSVRLNLVNHGALPCRLSGYPAISLLREDGSLIGSIAVEKVTATRLDGALKPGTNRAAGTDAPLRAPSPLVLLAPAGEASFEVGWTGSRADGAGCAKVGSVVVAAPGTTQSFTVRHAFTVCQGRIQVTAITDSTQL